MYKLTLNVETLSMYIETLKFENEDYIVNSFTEPIKIKGIYENSILIEFNGNIIPFNCYDAVNETESSIKTFETSLGLIFDVRFSTAKELIEEIKNGFVGTVPRRPHNA